MLSSSLNTGRTDLRDTEVQQPNTTETLSLVISSRAFSANSGQFDAGSTTTASSLRPRMPPFLFCASISIRMVSLSVVSLIAMVPDSECSTPTLIGGCCARAGPASSATAPAAMRVLVNLTECLLQEAWCRTATLGRGAPPWEQESDQSERSGWPEVACQISRKNVTIVRFYAFLMIK